jgi:hypothetical protein
MMIDSLMCAPASAAERIMFEEAGCGWCRQRHKEVGPSYPKTAQGRSAPLVRHQLSDPALATVSLQRPITSTPTFVLVEQGEVVGRMTGYPGADFYYGPLDAVLHHLPDWKNQRKSGT